MGAVRSAILVESTGGYDGGEPWGRFTFRRDGDAARWLRTFAALVTAEQLGAGVGRGAWQLSPGDAGRLTYMGGLVARELLLVGRVVGTPAAHSATPAARFADYAASVWVGAGGRPVPPSWWQYAGAGGAYEYVVLADGTVQRGEEATHPTSAFVLEAQALLPEEETARRARARAHFVEWSRRFDVVNDPPRYAYGGPDGSTGLYLAYGAGDAQAFNEVFTVLPTILGGLR
jgi:hypothetical protein